MATGGIPDGMFSGFNEPEAIEEEEVRKEEQAPTEKEERELPKARPQHLMSDREVAAEAGRRGDMGFKEQLSEEWHADPLSKVPFVGGLLSKPVRERKLMEKLNRARVDPDAEFSEDDRNELFRLTNERRITQSREQTFGGIPIPLEEVGQRNALVRCG